MVHECLYHFVNKFYLLFFCLKLPVLLQCFPHCKENMCMCVGCLCSNKIGRGTAPGRLPSCVPFGTWQGQRFWICCILVSTTAHCKLFKQGCLQILKNLMFFITHTMSHDLNYFVQQENRDSFSKEGDHKPPVRLRKGRFRYLCTRNLIYWLTYF